ncbi:MAG: DedA family protein [Candidatus Kapabacteria bacterium]|jgi:membrane protein DedA with SNARE-associated domain|nr:DedA family protein [Candidatus Kapabacteria bacterium]
MFEFFNDLVSIESIVTLMSEMPWIWILVFSVGITFLENIFPPSPCDVLIVFAGSLVAIGNVGFAELLLATTLGSTLGFVLMFWFGRRYGRRVINSHKCNFITEQSLIRPNRWLSKYGYFLILNNRFLSGTRGVISFLAGMSEMNQFKTILSAFLGALIWNAILIYGGKLLGSNWRIAEQYIKDFGFIVFPSMIGITVIYIVYIVMKNGKKQTV